MGLFDKLFGKRVETNSYQPTVPPLQSIIPVDNTKAAGEFPQRDFTPECEEGPRTIKLHQLRYGKTLQRKDGPIVSGSEHGVTECTPDFPQGIPTHPSDFMKHSTHLSHDLAESSYPWKNEGGEIVKKIIEVGGEQYVVCAKRMMRSEKGEGTSGRNYTEMHEIAIPAKEWSIAIIPQLGDILETKGVTEKNYQKDPIEVTTEILDEPLEEDWFDEGVKEMIARVVCGKPIGYQDYDLSEKDFFKRLFYALMCIPENIARQISFGTGMTDSVVGDVRIIHCMKVRYNNRQIAGEWKGIAPEDVAFGQNYLMNLVQAKGEAKTPREIMRAVREKVTEETKKGIEKKFKI